MNAAPGRFSHTGGAGQLVVLALLVASPVAAADWWVRCDPSTGAVEAVDAARAEGELAMAEGFPGPATARAWIEEHCPSARCDDRGQCVAGPPPTATGTPAAGTPAAGTPAAGTPAAGAPAAGAPRSGGAAAGETTADGWEAGELVDLGSDRPASPPARPSPPAAVGPSGPSRAHLDLFVATAHAAADACRHDAALAAATQMAEFDPRHPFLAANGEKLRELARRQKRTETAVWRAAQLLEQQNLKDARKVAREAAASALGCQTVAVSQLAAGIEEADARLRAERSVANRRAAAALIAPLMSLANALQGEGTVGGAGVPGTYTSAAGGAVAAPVVDRCTFDFSYPNKWSTEPVCRCAGWSFDARQFGCVRR